MQENRAFDHDVLDILKRAGCPVRRNRKRASDAVGQRRRREATAGAGAGYPPLAKTVAQSFLMLITVQPSLAARSSDFSAPAV